VDLGITEYLQKLYTLLLDNYLSHPKSSRFQIGFIQLQMESLHYEQ